jgi:hypothetical protein
MNLDTVGALYMDIKKLRGLIKEEVKSCILEATQPPNKKLTLRDFIIKHVTFRRRVAWSEILSWFKEDQQLRVSKMLTALEEDGTLSHDGTYYRVVVKES